MVEIMDEFDFGKIEMEMQELEKIPIEIRRYVSSYVDGRFTYFLNGLPQDLKDQIISNWGK